MTHDRILTRLLAPALILLATAASAGCATTPAPPAATATSASTATSSPTPSPSIPASVACLEGGTWVADLARASGRHTAMWETRTPGSFVEFRGERTFTFADGTLTRTTSGYSRLVSTLSRTGGRYEGTTTQDGTLTTPYTATEREFTIPETDGDDITVVSHVVVDGAPLPEDVVAEDSELWRADEVEAHTWWFSCDGDTLLLSERDEDMPPTTDELTEDRAWEVLHRR